jgi:hypothetical protein
MRKFNLIITSIILILSSFLFSGCEIIGDIFKAGVWVGVILVVAIIFLLFKLLGGKKE